MAGTTGQTSRRLTEHDLAGMLRTQYVALRRLMPHHRDLDLNLVIREVAAVARTTAVFSWQQAWNAATGATRQRPGRLSFWAHIRCGTCHGRLIDLRRGQPCIRCMGRGHVSTQITQTALWAEPPTDEAPVGSASPEV